MLNVAHVKNDVKWRPIVTKFGTLISHILYQCAKCGDDRTSLNVICDVCDV